MSQLSLLTRSPLQQALAALRADLLHEDGPRISTMRNYRFAILPYLPKDEYLLRAEIHKLSHELISHGWSVLTISLQHLLTQRLRAQGMESLRWIIDSERDLSEIDAARGLAYLSEEITPLIEGPGGLAADCARIIRDHLAAHPERADRTVALIGRVGALYPFFRTSALLRHLDGHTHNIPVVLLYPGERRGPSGLSFMGVHDPDHDYRPRIYP